MAGPIANRLRRLWFDVHMWIGVGLALAIIPISVTGAILVWHEPLERLVYTERFAVSETPPSLPAQAYVDEAVKAFDGKAAPTTVRYGEPGLPVTVIGRMDGPLGANGRPRQLTAWLDPATARVTDVADVSTSPFQIMHRLHGSLLIPEIGRKSVGWIGWAMTISCLTGLWLWWPRGAFAKALRWRRSPSVFDNLHHMIGFWICLPLAVLSLTGVYISFPQTSRAVFGVEQAAPGPQGKGGPQAKAGGGRGAAPAPPLKQTSITIDEAIAVAKAEQPAGRITQVTLPTEGRNPVWRVQLQDEGAGQPTAWQVGDADRAIERDRGGGGGRATQDPLSRLMRTVHDGVGTPFIWQLIVFLGGVAPAVLALTGVVMWARNQLRKLRARSPEAQPAE